MNGSQVRGLLECVEAKRTPLPENNLAEAPYRAVRQLQAFALVDHVREREGLGRRVVGQDEHRRHAESRPYSLANSLCYSAKVELLGKRFADLVDHR